MSKCSYPQIPQLYRSNIEWKNLRLQSNGKLRRLDLEKIKYITLTAI